MFNPSDVAIKHLRTALQALRRPDKLLEDHGLIRANAYIEYADDTPCRKKPDPDDLKRDLEQARTKDSEGLRNMCSEILRRRNDADWFDEHGLDNCPQSRFLDPIAMFENKIPDDGYKFDGFEIRDVATPLQQAQPHIGALLNRVTRDDARTFLVEADRCLRASAPRAAIVMTWIVVLDHLYEYVLKRKLPEFNAELAKRDLKRLSPVVEKTDFTEIKDKDFIELCRAAKVFDGDVKKILDEKLGVRNTAGHPSTVAVRDTKAAEFIQDLVENVVLKFTI